MLYVSQCPLIFNAYFLSFNLWNVCNNKHTVSKWYPSSIWRMRYNGVCVWSKFQINCCVSANSIRISSDFSLSLMDFVHITTYASYSIRFQTMVLLTEEGIWLPKRVWKNTLSLYIHTHTHTYTHTHTHTHFVVQIVGFIVRNYITTICFRNMKILGHTPLKPKLAAYRGSLCVSCSSLTMM
jgi:hypothetical protein